MPSDEPASWIDISRGVVLVNMSPDTVTRRAPELAHQVIDAMIRLAPRRVLFDLSDIERLEHSEINWLVNLTTAVELMGIKPFLVGVNGALAYLLRSSLFEIPAIVRSREFAVIASARVARDAQ